MGKKFPFSPWQQQGDSSKIHVQISATDLFKIKKAKNHLSSALCKKSGRLPVDFIGIRGMLAK